MDFLPPSPEDRLSGASGEPLEVIGSFVAHFSLGAADCSHRVRVVRGLSHECIVGWDLSGSIQCSIVSDGNGRLQFFTSPSRTSTGPLRWPVCMLSSRWSFRRSRSRLYREGFVAVVVTRYRTSAWWSQTSKHLNAAHGQLIG